MKISRFLVRVLEIATSNPEVKNTWNEFNLIRKLEPKKKDVNLKIKEEDALNEMGKSESPEELINDQARINNFIVKNTTVERVELNCLNLLEYSFNMFCILSIDNNIEVFRYKFVFLKRLLELSNNNEIVTNTLRKVFDQMKDHHKSDIIKFREVSLKMIKFTFERTVINMAEGRFISQKGIFYH